MNGDLDVDNLQRFWTTLCSSCPWRCPFTSCISCLNTSVLSCLSAPRAVNDTELYICVHNTHQLYTITPTTSQRIG